MIDLTVGEQVFQRHLHEHDNLVFGAITVLQKHAPRAIQHVVGGVRDRPETSALNQDRFLVKNFSRLRRLAIRLEHYRIR